MQPYDTDDVEISKNVQALKHYIVDNMKMNPYMKYLVTPRLTCAEYNALIKLATNWGGITKLMAAP